MEPKDKGFIYEILSQKNKQKPVRHCEKQLPTSKGIMNKKDAYNYYYNS